MSKNVLSIVEKILSQDLEYSRKMQSVCKTREERIAWQNRIIHDIDLRNQIRVEVAMEEEK